MNAQQAQAIRLGIRDSRADRTPRRIYGWRRLQTLYMRAWGLTEHGLSHQMLRMEWSLRGSGSMDRG